MQSNEHEKHRERLRQRYMESGLSGFHDHQILELLLFYTIPRADTNPVAHRLLDHFGTLYGVFNASVRELMKVNGVGERSAVLIHMMPEMFRAYELSRYDDKTMLSSVEEIGQYCRNLLLSHTNEAFYMICLDSVNRIVSTLKLQEGIVDEVHVYTRSVIESALNCNAKKVILAHNHPSGVLIPSRSDVHATERVMLALNAINVELIDHILVADNNYMSMKQEELI